MNKMKEMVIERESIANHKDVFQGRKMQR